MGFINALQKGEQVNHMKIEQCITGIEQAINKMYKDRNSKNVYSNYENRLTEIISEVIRIIFSFKLNKLKKFLLLLIFYMTQLFKFNFVYYFFRIIFT